ncbi:Permeases of the major facilitator superfamily [Paramagnetospirillum magnetotacticum MS-1]|uniref:Permeases of the major facilitator superfamily n=1 Tax=Paramagnetospirillum magnetotacticum MS-1 TaxID=272627 RepID=A0A0C2YWA5_PARME|nr:YbfB/YjiJ family MFS transporter [Paramagnetospirillum magnetotacticum]KIL98980.1 Permeases of the major facilitator superfamily [Paramagnetospirillum magnetotacticum MS-1]
MHHPGPWRSTVSALFANLVGIGLARFAYSPLIPALVVEGWFEASAAAYLGAANLAGYLAGALSARALGRRLGPALALKVMMGLIAASFLVCAQPAPFAWFFIWRFASGLAGGVIMVLAATLVLPHVPESRRGLAGGLIFMGVGLGAVASATLLPLLLAQGMSFTWIALGLLCLGFTLAAWSGWPEDAVLPASTPAAPLKDSRLRALMVIYALNAFGLVPHMVFLVDFVARGLNQGIGRGAFIWFLFGLGATVGPVILGRLGDHFGFGRVLRGALATQVLVVGLASTTSQIGWLGLSALIMGSFTPGVVPVVLGRVRELLPGDFGAQRTAWSRTTAAFALGQAAGAYGLSWVFATEKAYPPLFALGAVALALALALELVVRRRNVSAPV